MSRNRCGDLFSNFIMMFSIGIGTLLLLFSTPRILRWLAIVQQKEYRLDRLAVFLKSVEGQKELRKVLPLRKELTRTGLKRPVRTGKIVVISLTFIAVFLALWIVPSSNTILRIFLAAALYFLIPLLVVLSSLPAILFTEIATFLFLILASRKLNQSKTTIIGITGSYGKTITKHLIAAVLEEKFSVFKTPKSHNTRLSVALSVLRQFDNQNFALLEYGAYKKNEIKKLARWFKPDAAVITGFTPQHIALFGGRLQIIKAKAELVYAVNGGPVFCNSADPGAEEICSAGNRSNFIRSEDVETSDFELNSMGRLVFSWQNNKVHTKLVGRHYLQTVKLAIAVGKYYNLQDGEIVSGLENYQPGETVVNVYRAESGALIIDDGKTSNPKGFKAALQLTAELAERRKAENVYLLTPGIVDLGKWTDEIHLDLAKQARPVVNKLLHVGEDGTEQFREVFEEDYIAESPDILKFLNAVGEGDLVLIEGKVARSCYSGSLLSCSTPS